MADFQTYRYLNRASLWGLCIFILSSLSSQDASSQSLNAADTLEAYTLYIQADSAYNRHEIRKALSLIDSSTEAYRRVLHDDQWPLFKCLGLQVRVLIAMHAYIRAYPIVQEQLQLGESKLREDHPRLGLIYKNLAIVETELKKYKLAELHLQKAGFLIRQDSMLHREHEGTMMMEMGILQRRIDRIDDGINYYLLALEAFEREGNQVGLAKTHHNLGNAYYNVFENALARYHYQSALKLYDAEALFNKALALEGIALTYRQERVYDLALKNLYLALDYVEESYGKDHYYYARLVRIIADNHAYLGEFQQGIDIMKGASGINKRRRAQEVFAKCYYGIKDLKQAQIHTDKALSNPEANIGDSLIIIPIYADVLLSLGDTNKAEQILYKVIEQCHDRTLYMTDKIQVIYYKLAEIEFKRRNFDKALIGIDSLLKSPNNMYVKLKSGRKIRSTIWDDLMQLKCKIYYQQYLFQSTEKNWNKTLVVASKYLQSMDTLRRYAATVGAQLNISGRPTAIIEIVLDLLYDEYKKQPGVAIVERTLREMDLVRDMLWMDLVQYRQGADLSPSQWKSIAEQNAIRKEIATLELQARFHPDSVLIHNRLLTLSEELQDKKAQSKDVYDLNLSELDEIVLGLQHLGRVCLNYFITDEHLYRVFISQDTVLLDRFEWNPSYDVLIVESARILTSIKLEYTPHVDSLSQLLLGGLPVAKDVDVTIYPDGVLHMIPFEVLKFPGEDAMMIATHGVSYSSSLKRTFFNYESRRYKHELTAFAPTYDDWEIFEADTTTNAALAAVVRSDIVRLPATLDEVNEISRIVSGRRYINEEATIDNFYSQCANSRILHLSMHALVEMDQPSLSRLVFSANESKDPTSRYCFAGELAAQEIPAELVVLSACNTGRGEFVRGDGVQSLARSFEYAGAHSIVHSLWKIPDAATKELMESFYQQLRQGKSKSEALRMAKLNYKERHVNTTLAHPYYWAGFVLSGSPDTILYPTKSTLMQFLPWLVWALILLLGLRYLILSKAKKTK